MLSLVGLSNTESISVATVEQHPLKPIVARNCLLCLVSSSKTAQPRLMCSRRRVVAPTGRSTFFASSSSFRPSSQRGVSLALNFPQTKTTATTTTSTLLMMMMIDVHSHRLFIFPFFHVGFKDFPRNPFPGQI
uniref:(northern house mosquito) hypothetical protein n=1 Tax=Culex pipiens TaxID=7175 RepID=A0A8D8A1S2_CULPI